MKYAVHDRICFKTMEKHTKRVGKDCIDMVVIDQDRCIGCGICASDCIALNIEVADGKAAIKNECLQCGHCAAICPEAAISIPEYDMSDIEEYEEGKFELDSAQFLRVVKFRRSIRSYKPVKVEKDLLFQLAEAGRYTATACNYQTSRFVFVQEELDVLKEFVWDHIEKHKNDADPGLAPYLAFNERRKKDPADDYLFRNAPVVVVVTSDRMLDAGLAAQNMEIMAVSQGLGMLYNGFLARIIETNSELKKWLNIEENTVCACMLLGYPDVQYLRTAPRKKAQIIWK